MDFGNEVWGMRVETSGTSRFNVCEFKLSRISKKGAKSCASVICNGLVDSLKRDRVIMA